MGMTDITEKPYAEWLEDTIRTIMESKPVSMAFCARTEDGLTLTGYYNADAEDMAVMAHHMYSDAMLDVMKHNASEIIAAAEDDNEEESDGET